MQNADWIFLSGNGSTPQGDLPFFDRFNLTTLKSERIFRCETGSYEAKTTKGRSRSPLKRHEEWLLALVKHEPDLTLGEIQRRLLEERQQTAGIGSVWRFFERHGISFKKKPTRGGAGSA